MRLLILSLLFFAFSSPAIASTVEAVPVLHVTGRNVAPNTHYSTSTYVYRYEGDPHPYTLGYDASSVSTSWGTVKIDIPLEELGETFYGSWPVYEVNSCLQETPSYNTVGCAYVYVGWTPESLWK